MADKITTSMGEFSVDDQSITLTLPNGMRHQWGNKPPLWARFFPMRKLRAEASTLWKVLQEVAPHNGRPSAKRPRMLAAVRQAAFKQRRNKLKESLRLRDLAIPEAVRN